MRTLIIIFLLFGVSLMSYADEEWLVAEATIDGKQIIYKFISKLPDESQRKAMPWLTVVSWKYDGSINSGLPSKEENDQLIKLEDGLETIEGRNSLFLDVYTATGNNLKEFVFYIADREMFMSNFNKALTGHSAYSIEINFYEDKSWDDLKNCLIARGNS